MLKVCKELQIFLISLLKSLMLMVEVSSINLVKKIPNIYKDFFMEFSVKIVVNK